MMSTDDLEDAIIEDTVYCTVCGASWVFGGNEGAVILDPPCDIRESVRRGLDQVKLCPECVLRVVDEYKESLREAGICEHGVNDGDYCEECNRAYKEAAREAGFESEEERR